LGASGRAPVLSHHTRARTHARTHTHATLHCCVSNTAHTPARVVWRQNGCAQQQHTRVRARTHTHTVSSRRTCTGSRECPHPPPHILRPPQTHTRHKVRLRGCRQGVETTRPQNTRGAATRMHMQHGSRACPSRRSRALCCQTPPPSTRAGCQQSRQLRAATANKRDPPNTQHAAQRATRADERNSCVSCRGQPLRPASHSRGARQRGTSARAHTQQAASRRATRANKLPKCFDRRTGEKTGNKKRAAGEGSEG
jgi:hypothetical protein